MTLSPGRSLPRAWSLLLVLVLTGMTLSRGQEANPVHDEALDALLEKLDDAAEEGPAGDRGRSADDKSKPAADQDPATDSMGKKGDDSGQISPQDKELDDLLERLGQTEDQPTPNDPTENRPGGDPDPSKRPPQADREAGETNEAKQSPALDEKERELDQRLEELTGRRRRRPHRDTDEDSGPLGQIVKEMREVEQRLGKPDTGEDTQNRQKQIVKRIQTLIEQARQSGSSQSLTMRRERPSPGQKPGSQPAQQPGATPGQAPPMKPEKPVDRPSLVGGKDVWGHLPADLRQEMENVFKEDALAAKRDLIRRYYLSVARGRLIRGE